MNVADESACLTTRVGTIELEVPRDRGHLPDGLVSALIWQNASYTTFGS